MEWESVSSLGMAWLTGHCEVGTNELAEVSAYCSGQQYRDG